MTDATTADLPAEAAPAGAKARLDHAVATARDTASRALETTKGSAADAAAKVSGSIETNPLSLLAGGLAIGAVAAAFLPMLERESELLHPLGKRITDGATSAAQAALDTGKGELAGLGLSRDALKQQGQTLLDGVLKALATAGQAAADGAKKA